ncbi:MAG: glycosyltransferase family 39 protein [Pseudomonadota bacterium]
MAHDEALYVNRGRQMLDSGDWVHPFAQPHFKPPGFYWIQGAVVGVFGLSEYATRLPSALCAAASLWLIWQIGRALDLGPAARLAPLLLGTSYLFFFYGRLAVPDIPMLALSLVLCLGLLRSADPATARPRRAAMIAGAALGLIFLVRGPVGFVVLAALSPYLWASHSNGPCGRLNAFLTGLFAGLVPFLLWVSLATASGFNVLGAFFGFATELGTDTRDGNGPAYYAWNVGANSFPWSLVALFGAAMVLRNVSDPAKKSLMVGFPALYLLFISLFSTRIAHYALNAYPWIALLAAYAVVQASSTLANRVGAIAAITTGIALVSCALSLWFGVVDLGDFGGPAQPRIPFITLTAGAIGVTSGVWSMRSSDPRSLWGLPRGILALVAVLWVAFAGLATTSVVGNVNPSERAMFQEPAVVAALTEPVDFVGLRGKISVLMRVYTPMQGIISATPAAYSGNGPLWIPPTLVAELPGEPKVIAQTRDVALVVLEK